MGSLLFKVFITPVLRYWTISLYMRNMFELQVVFSCTGYNSTFEVGGFGGLVFFIIFLFIYFYLKKSWSTQPLWHAQA